MTYQETKARKHATGIKAANKTMMIIATIIVIFGAFLMLFPYFYMIIIALKSPTDMSKSGSLLQHFWPSVPQWQHFSEVFTGNSRYPLDVFNFMDSMKNTLIIELLVVPIGTFTTTLAAFAFAKMKFKFKNILLIVILSSMMIPFAAVMLPQYRAFSDLGMVNTLWPLIIPGFFGNMGMMLFLITTIKSTVPDSLIEESRVEGASWFRTFFKVVVPLIKPAIFAQMLFWFVGIWNDFFGPSIYLTNPETRTLQVSIMALKSTSAGESLADIPFVMAATFMSSVPVILLFICMNKSFVQSNNSAGIKG